MYGYEQAAPPLPNGCRSVPLNPFDTGSGQCAAEHARRVRLYGLQNLFGADAVVSDGNGGYDRTLPGIEMIDFGHGDIEALAKPVFQALDDVALFLERMRVLNMYVERQYTDCRHPASRALLRDRNLWGDSFHGKRLQHVADLNVVEVRDRNAALKTVLDLACVIFEALESFDSSGVNDLAVPHDSNLAIAADCAVGDITAGDRTNLADLKGLADFRVSLNRFLVDGLKHARHGLLHFVYQFIDDVVKPDIDLLLFGSGLRVPLRTNVKADDQSIGCRSEQNVVFGDCTDPGPKHADAHLLIRKLL